MTRPNIKKKKVEAGIAKAYAGVRDQKFNQAMKNLNQVLHQAQLKIKSRASSSNLLSVKK